MSRLAKRVPPRGDFAPMLALCAFPVYSWSVIWFLQKMPGWLPFLPVWDIISIFAYTQAFALFETLLVLGLLTSLSVALPDGFLRKRFVGQGGIVVLIVSFWFLLFQLIFEAVMQYWSSSQFLFWLAVALVSIVLASLLVKRSIAVEKAILALADRMTVLLYLYLPLGLAGLLVVIARNIV